MHESETAAAQVGDLARFQTAMRRFDEENARDPNLEEVQGARQPRELVYAERLSSWVSKLAPNPPEALRLAARCQHLCRWMIPRSSHQMTRAGYLRWRNDLKAFHARRAGEILREVGYPEDLIARVQGLILKRDFPNDPAGRTLEDALCLVFLQYQLADLANKTSEDKVINALQKSWNKMTPAARQVALKLDLGERERALIGRALRDGGT